MDNNLINIDDLVRQRLGGSEEREPAGAWLRMRDLLDEEMPKPPAAGLYWRRFFGGLAVLLLLSLLSFGGYEATSYFRDLSGGKNGGAMADASAATTTKNPTNTQAAAPVSGTGMGVSTDEKENNQGNNNNSNNQATDKYASTTTNNNITNGKLKSAAHNQAAASGNTALAAKAGSTAISGNEASKNNEKIGAFTAAKTSTVNHNVNSGMAAANRDAQIAGTVKTNETAAGKIVDLKKSEGRGAQHQAQSKSGTVSTEALALAANSNNESGAGMRNSGRKQNGGGSNASVFGTFAAGAGNDNTGANTEAAVSEKDKKAAGSNSDVAKADNNNTGAKKAAKEDKSVSSNSKLANANNSQTGTSDAGKKGKSVGGNAKLAKANNSNTGTEEATKDDKSVSGNHNKLAVANNSNAGTGEGAKEGNPAGSNKKLAKAERSKKPGNAAATKKSSKNDGLANADSKIGSGEKVSGNATTKNGDNNAVAVENKKALTTKGDQEKAKAPGTRHERAKGGKQIAAAGTDAEEKQIADPTQSNNGNGAGVAVAGMQKNAKTTANAHNSERIERLPLGSHSSTPVPTGMDAHNGADHIGAVKANNTANANNGTTGIANNKKAGSRFASTGTKTSYAQGGKNEQATAGSIANSGERKMGKRQIERLVLHQHFVKTSAFQGHYELDTVSIEKMTEEFALANNDDNAAAGTSVPGSARKSSVANSAGSSSATTPLTPGASSSAAAGKQQSTGSLKEMVSDKKNSGTSPVQSLTAAFNDIKSHIAGVQFAAGLTAGINGTFFGPASFKGFQFGVTGNFTFNETVSVMGELKYFHRINSDYTVNDNYYTYTQNSTGGYNRQLQTNGYSFSGLQALELPVSIRYHVANFNFFAGGNLSYMFGINTAADPTVSNAAPTVVQSPGNDNKPQININDFGTRFGLGYLLGISYQVSPNTMIDFRNVQTIWDNAGTNGARTISGQLYKSPSLQLSLGYRLGGNKKKE